jgi:hypothetical protein
MKMTWGRESAARLAGVLRNALKALFLKLRHYPIPGGIDIVRILHSRMDFERNL